MRAVISVLTNPAQITSTTAVEPTAFSAYNAGTTYGFGALISVAADFSNYESLAAGNLAHTPNISPLWWRKIGPTETAWADATVYAVGATSYSTTAHHNYECLTAHTSDIATGKVLPVLPETENTYWIDVGATNKYAAFDLDRNKQTVYASPHVWVITPGERVNSICLQSMSANTLTIKVTSTAQGGTIYPLAYDETKTYTKNECMTVGLTDCYQSKADDNLGHSAPDATWWTAVSGYVFDLNTRQVFNATDYCYNPFSTRPSLSLFDNPPVTDAVITITLAATAGNVKCGAIGAGLYIYMGTLLKPARNEGKGFSTIDRDAWGNATLVKRRMLPVMKGPVLLDSWRIDSLLAARSVLDAVPAFYVGVEEDGDWTDMFSIIGVHQQFDLETNNATDKATLLFEAEGI